MYTSSRTFRRSDSAATCKYLSDATRCLTAVAGRTTTSTPSPPTTESHFHAHRRCPTPRSISVLIIVRRDGGECTLCPSVDGFHRTLCARGCVCVGFSKEFANVRLLDCQFDHFHLLSRTHRTQTSDEGIAMNFELVASAGLCPCVVAYADDQWVIVHIL